MMKRVKQFPMSDRCARFVVNRVAYYNPEWVRQRYFEAQRMHEACMVESFYRHGKRKQY